MDGLQDDGEGFDIIQFMEDVDYIHPEVLLLPSSSGGPDACTQLGSDSVHGYQAQPPHENHPLETFWAMLETGSQPNKQKNVKHQEGILNPVPLDPPQRTADTWQGRAAAAPAAEAAMVTQTQGATRNTDQTQQPQVMIVQQQMPVDTPQVDQSQGRRNKPKKFKMHQQTTPFEDQEREVKRLGAIKAKKYRDMKKRKEDHLKQEVARLEHELRNSILQINQLAEDNRRLRQEECFKNQLTEQNEHVRQENDQLKKLLQSVKSSLGSVE